MEAAAVDSAEAWTAAVSRSRAAREGGALSAPASPRERPGDAVAGLLASLSLFASLIGIAYRPGRLIPVALLLALLATAIGGRHQRLATWALVLGGLCFVVGMALAVITDNPLY